VCIHTVLHPGKPIWDILVHTFYVTDLNVDLLYDYVQGINPSS
jgi:hypothetical protein